MGQRGAPPPSHCLESLKVWTQSSGDMKAGEQTPGQLPSHPSGGEIPILQGSFESDLVAAGEVCSLAIQKPKRWSY